MKIHFGPTPTDTRNQPTNWDDLSLEKDKVLTQLQDNAKLETYLRSPSTSGRSLVIAMTKANSVTKHVMKATGELQIEKYHMALDIISSLNVRLQ
jgi:hypothetical protein